MSSSEVWTYYNPVSVEIKSLDNLIEYVTGPNILIVTTPGNEKRGVVDRVKKILACHQVTVWCGVKSNPNIQDLTEAIEALRSLNVNCVVGLGGGSSLDVAKVLAVMLPSTTGPTLLEIFQEEVKPRWSQRLPLITIPTTSGTGSEVTPYATIWDPVKGKKYSLAGNFVYPDIALLDVNLTTSLSYEDTLYPALDAISHALESLWNKNCTPITEAYALQALDLINKSLPNVLIKLPSIQSRQSLQIASMLAGMAISQTKTALAHSISYPITLHYGVPHGLASSFTLPRLISLFIKNNKNSSFNKIFRETEKILNLLNLDEKILQYTTKEKLVKIIPQMIMSNRANNYQLLNFITEKELEKILGI